MNGSMDGGAERAGVGDRPARRGWLERIERAGNALPDPMVLFAAGACLVFLASWVATRTGWECRFSDAQGNVLKAEQAKNLLSAEGFRWLFTNLVKIFMDFRPLGLVLAVSIGVAVAERSGLIAAALRSVLILVPRSLLTPATFLAGISSTLAADAGFIVLPPLAAAVYASVGRSPLLGIAAVTAGVAVGFGSNVFLTTQDVMLSGMTEPAARLLDPDYVVNAACNWYFKIASTVVLVLVGWLVAARYVEPRFVRRRQTSALPAPSALSPELSTRERGALLLALAVMLGTLAVFVLCWRSEWGFLYDPPPPPGERPATATWITAIVPLLLLLFLLPGLAYGLRTGTIRSSRDVARMMSEYLAVLATYVVLAFFASILVAAFERSNLGVMLAIAGGNGLRELELPRWALLLALILLSSSIDILVVSMSAKWAMLSTILVPMYMTLGISPELTQASYRIGDSITNPISPLNMYLFVVLSFLQQHDRKAGLGTLIALLAPYALAFAVAWIALLFLWIGLGWPLGPHGPLVYTPGR